MPLQFAAHVGHPIAHRSHTIASVVSGIVLGVGAAAAFAFIATAGAPVVIAGMSVSISVGAWGLWGGAAINAAKLADSFVPASNECEIVDGHPTVLLGALLRRAARADYDTKIAKAHTSYMAEGSDRTMVGTFRKPMSRVGDHSECNGVITEGIQSIIVGGNSSAHGRSFDEADPAVVYWGILLTAFADGIGNIREGAEAVEHGRRLAGRLQQLQGAAEAAAQGAKLAGAPVTGAAGDVIGARPFTGGNLQTRLANAWNAGFIYRDGAHELLPHGEH